MIDRDRCWMARISPVVGVLLIMNVAVFLAGLLVPRWNELLIVSGAFWFPAHELFRPWQAVSYMFLHAGLGHVFFNMFALVSFGSLLERQWGAGRFLVLYFLCGVGAGLIQVGISGYEFSNLHSQLIALGMTPSDITSVLSTGRGQLPPAPAAEEMIAQLYRIYAAPMLGASGAIYGVLVAFGLLYPNAKLALIFLPVPIAAKFFIPILLGLDLLSGVTGFSLFGAGVAHFAHLGGAAIGFALALLWRRHSRRVEFGTPLRSGA